MSLSHSISLPLPVAQMDLAALYIKAGTKNIGIVFLMTDAQVADEKFLVLINDLLASGNGPLHSFLHDSAPTHTSTGDSGFNIRVRLV